MHHLQEDRTMRSARRVCRVEVLHTRAVNALLFFSHRVGERAKGRFKVGPFWWRGATTGRRNYTVRRPILRVIPRYYVEIIIIDCLLAA